MSTPSPRTVADQHPEWPTCPTCAASLMRCVLCGDYADEHETPCVDGDGQAYEFVEQDTYDVQTARETHWEPAEYDSFCRRPACGRVA